jgi:hypothetical protein
MLKRFRRHLNPPMVVAMIALFAALGGGYATAFSGSGTLQKAAVDNLSTTFTDVRSLTGFGALQAQCDPGEDDFDIRLDNSSDAATVFLRGSRASGTFVAASAAPGNPSDSFDLGDDAVWVHISKLTRAGNKAQVNVMITAADTETDCTGNEHLRIIALNTQE